MTTTAIRERLHDYINVADDKEIQAIYAILEDRINHEHYDWSDDLDFVAELDERVKRWENGVDRGYTWDEVKASIEELKHKRATK
jgi:hypothetical protein